VIFTLEALQAAHGDALLLHWGPADASRLALIDAGPVGIYKSSVRPRLEEIRARRAPDATLPLDFVLVSHIDDDHIHGITDLTKELVEAADSAGNPPFEIKNLWHNTFDDVVGDDEVQAVAPAAAMAAMEAAAGAPEGMSRESALVLASVGQGDRLRRDAERLSCIVNDDRKLLLAPVELDMGNGLKATIVGPLEDQLRALQTEWDKVVKKKQDATPKDHAAAIAAYVDKSVANLSSIVVLADLAGKQILLTGDARGDFVLEGLKAAGALDGTLHLDVLKVPHHGSNRDVEVDFFEQVTADHYVISADGRDGNPDAETLEMIAAARGKDEFTIHLTNHDGEGGLRERLDAFAAGAKVAGAKLQLAYLGEPGAIRIELGDPLGF
jgi:beta-lactamase superfamily II metal-dependent hydrolase